MTIKRLRKRDALIVCKGVSKFLGNAIPRLPAIKNKVKRRRNIF